MLTTAHFIVAGLTVLTVLLVVALHYEAFVRLSGWLRRPGPDELKMRERLLALVLSLIVLHVAEIWLFALTGWGLTEFVPGAGGIHAPYPVSFLDQVYLSAATFTTVGYGDVYPHGPIRFLFGTEALVGFALITWSASLTFLEMQRHWSTSGDD
jgi:hypothetical protein